MFLPLVILFIAVPILELYVLLQVGGAIGVLPTIGLLVADSILGGVLMRSQGRAAWRHLNEAVAAGRAPAKEVLDGVLVIFGGALLLTPGFISDIFGLLLLLPPTRAVVRALLVRRFAARMLASVVRGPRGPQTPTGAAPFGGRRRPRPGDPRFDVEGEAHEVDPKRRELP